MRITSSTIGSFQHGAIRIEIFVLATLCISLALVLLAEQNTSRPVEPTAAVQSERSRVVHALRADGQPTGSLELQTVANNDSEVR